MKVKCFLFGFIVSLFCSTAFSDVLDYMGQFQIMTLQDYSEGEFYTQFVNLFNKKYGPAGLDNHIIPRTDKEFLISKIPSSDRRHRIVIVQYWLRNNTESSGTHTTGYYLTLFHFNKDGEYVSSSWLIGL